jgi:hypothetical protein
MGQRRAWTYGGRRSTDHDDLDSIPRVQQIHEQVRRGCRRGPPLPASARMMTWEPLLRHFGNAVDRDLRVVSRPTGPLTSAPPKSNPARSPTSSRPIPPPAFCWVRDRTAIRLAGSNSRSGYLPAAGTSSPPVTTTVGTFSWLRPRTECNRHVKSPCEGCWGAKPTCSNDWHVSFAVGTVLLDSGPAKLPSLRPRIVGNND